MSLKRPELLTSLSGGLPAKRFRRFATTTAPWTTRETGFTGSSFGCLSASSHARSSWRTSRDWRSFASKNELQRISFFPAGTASPCRRLDACDFGVPQTRKRLLFVGLRASLGDVPVVLRGSRASEHLLLTRTENGAVGYRPSPCKLYGARFLGRLLDTEDASIVTTRQAISDLAFLRSGQRADDLSDEDLPRPESAYQQLMRTASAVSNVSVPRINEDTILRLSAIPEGGNYLDLPHGLRDRYLTGQKWGPHNGSGRLGRRHYYAYRRLHPDFWAWTLNTKADSTYHWSVERALSVREFARIQSFPDRFNFRTDPRRGAIPGRIAGGAAHSRYRQVGNAVPPLLALAVAQELQAALSSHTVAQHDGVSV